MTGAAAPRPRGVSLRPGTIDWYLLRKLFAPFLLIEGGVILFLELERALRLIYELSVSGADISYFLPLLLELAPYFVNLGLPMAFFLALLLLVARLDDELELQAMLASGLSLTRIALPLIAAGVAVASLSIVTSGWFEPYGRFGFRTQKVEALNSGRTARLMPGAFYQPSDNLVLMIAPRDAPAPARVFAWHRGADGDQQVMTARSATLGLSEDATRIELTLRNGTALVDDPRDGRDGAHVLRFTQVRTSLPLLLDDAGWARGRDERELTLPELIAPGPERLARLGRDAIDAELYGRLGKAAIIPLMPLLVLPLTMAVRRSRRMPGAMAAGALFLMAQYAINMVRQRAVVGEIEALPAILTVVGVTTAVQIGLLIAGRNLPSHSPMSAFLAGCDRVMQRVTGRRRLGLAIPGHVMASYLAGRALLWTIVSALLLVAMLEMAEIFLLGDAFVRRGMGGAEVLRYALLRLPAHALQAVPAAALMGPIIAFFLLVRRRELLTIRLSGLSQMRLLAMLMPVPLLLGAASLLLSEYVVPSSQRVFRTWWQQDDPSVAVPTARWFGSGDAIIRVDSLSTDQDQIEGLTIIRRNASGAVVQRIDAAAAIPAPGGWRLIAATRLTIADGLVSRRDAAVDQWTTNVTADEVRAVMAAGDAYSATWARRALAGEAPTGLGEAAYRTRIWREGALPLAPLIMLLFAIPITTTSHTGHGRTTAVAYAVTAGALFLVIDSLMTVMALLGIVPVLPGVWAAPLCAATLALALVTWRDR